MIYVISYNVCNMETFALYREKFPEGSVCSSLLSNNKRLFDVIGMIIKWDRVKLVDNKHFGQ